MRTAIKGRVILISGAGALIAGLLLCLGLDSRPILIQSIESKTKTGGPVFNRIAWTPGWKQDVWMMQQSHVGLAPPFHEWDRLAIVVDKTRWPHTARFYQIEPGELRWNPAAAVRPYRAACFMCHSNGPRAIRPDPRSDRVRMSAWNRARVALWDLRVKTYGHIAPDPVHDPALVDGAAVVAGKLTPFRYPGAFENEKLAVSTCLKCHNDKWWGRGSLSRQNFIAIDFMVSNGIMPPPGFSLGADERKRVSRFVNGLPDHS
jgi:hypothetical protein